MNLKPIRRRLYKAARKLGLHHIAALCYPGMRLRVWDKQWKLIADSDRDDPIPSFEADVLGGYARILYEPNTGFRFSGVTR